MSRDAFDHGRVARKLASVEQSSLKSKTLSFLSGTITMSVRGECGFMKLMK